MKGLFSSFIMISLLFGAGMIHATVHATAHAIEVVDVTGFHLNIKARPKRIVSLIPSLGELAAEILQEDLGRIVGVSEFTDFPPVLKDKPSVGSYARFSIEKVVSLKPDLVLGTKDGNSRDQILHLRELGLPVLVVSTETLIEVEESILLVAMALGLEDRGRAVRSQLKNGIANIKSRAKGRPGTKVLLQIGDQPLIVVGKKSFLHEALKTIGAENVYGGVDISYPRPSLEDVVARNPDVIVVLALSGDTGLFERMAKAWQRFPKMKAVTNARIKVVQGDTVLRPSLRLLEGLSLLEKAVYSK